MKLRIEQDRPKTEHAMSWQNVDWLDVQVWDYKTALNDPVRKAYLAAHSVLEEAFRTTKARYQAEMKNAKDEAELELMSQEIMYEEFRWAEQQQALAAMSLTLLASTNKSFLDEMKAMFKKTHPPDAQGYKGGSQLHKQISEYGGRFGVDLETVKGFETVREVELARHCCVHNDGLLTEDYRQKTNHRLVKGVCDSVEVGFSQSANAVARASAEQRYGTIMSRCFFQLELVLVFFEECSQVWGRVQQSNPLFVIERYRKATQAVDADPAFVAHSELKLPRPLPPLLLFEFRDPRLQLLRSFFHVSPRRFGNFGTDRIISSRLHARSQTSQPISGAPAASYFRSKKLISPDHLGVAPSRAQTKRMDIPRGVRPGADQESRAAWA
jgi:hypothetical protein